MNINNQTEYKKPFGTRLFILLTVCMIVVAMAVPAFAANKDPIGITGEWIFNERISFPPLKIGQNPPEYSSFDFSYYYNGTNAGWFSFYGVFVKYFTGTSTVPEGNTLYAMQKRNDPSANYFPLYNFQTGSWYSGYDSRRISFTSSSPLTDVSMIDWVVANASPNNESDDPGRLLYEPNLGDEVTGVLPTVLSWIQQTLNALFVEGGALQGLLLLVAVPVAITLLLLGARFIRSVIWGA